MTNRYFAEDVSGALAVDWVVLTAALVVIGGLVIGATRIGLVDGTGAGDENLTASLQGGGTTAGDSPATWDEYLAAAGSEAAAFSAIAQDTPDGYHFSGMVDGGGTPIYTNADPGSSLPESYSIGGEIILASDYSGTIRRYGPY